MAESSPKRVENTLRKGETVFSKDLYCRLVKTRLCFGKGLPTPSRHFQYSKNTQITGIS